MRKIFLLWVVLLLGGISVMYSVTKSRAQVIEPPFQIIGPIQRFTLDTPNDPLSGARMIVNGIDVIIPRNTIILMPGSFLTAGDIFAMAPAGATQRGTNGTCANPAGGRASNLALEDCPGPVAAFEATLDGNLAGGSHIAGLVSITQNSLNAAGGFIQGLNTATGEITVGARLAGPTLARVRINDSAGRYGRQNSTYKLGEAANPAFTEDGRFTVDTDNPTIHSSSGYPMCMPRSANDPECPMKNRPTNAAGLVNTFVMGNQPYPNFPNARLCPACDPSKQAPLMIGDHITYSGIMMKDAIGYYVSAYAMDVNVGIYTPPGRGPAYLMIEGSIIGTGGKPIKNGANDVAQEVATRSIRIEGFTTDPSSVLDIYAVDVEPCTGDERLRFLAAANPAEQPVFGRFRIDLRRVPAQVGTITRELMVYHHRKAVEANVTAGAAPPDLPVVANGLMAGQYRFPVGEYIFPENRVFGDPLVPLNMQDLPFLAQGSGPLKTRNRGAAPLPAGPRVGTLAPWPGAAITPKTCP